MHMTKYWSIFEHFLTKKVLFQKIMKNQKKNGRF